MRKYIGALLALLACASCLCSCNNDDTYADQKKRERKVINAFLNRDVAIIDEEGDTICRVGKINPITEAQFYAQDSTTNVEKNEYVLFSGSGIYMQIVREGVGEKLKSGDNKRILCRFIEYNIMGDSLQLLDWNGTPVADPAQPQALQLYENILMDAKSALALENGIPVLYFTADDGDIAVTQRNQMFHRKFRSGGVIGADAG